MAKRKRVEIASNGTAAASGSAPSKKTKPTKASASKPSTEAQPKSKSTSNSGRFTLHVVTGSYDRVLHGILTTVTPGKDGEQVKFADSFLFNAHPSAIRCLGLSPPSAPVPGQEQKVLLASGSSDPKINIYSLSAHAPGSREKDESLSAAALRPILENSKNRELGMYNPHDSSVTKLAFPTRSKLISSSEDSTIAVAKTRNWEQMSTIKAPIPKPQGRPSGDTAALGETPAGVNDFAVHPSMKLLLSVSRGERCMRLWNLLTGKKAAVLNFSKEMLQEIGERRHSTGEGRKVVWGTAADSEEFAVGFNRDIVVFGMDSLPRCRVMPDARTKIHHFEYLTLDEAGDSTVMAVSTEDGRIMFFSTRDEDLTAPNESSDSQPRNLKVAKLIGQVGGKDAGVSGRIKDFTVVLRDEGGGSIFYLVSGSSDGTVRLWRVAAKELKKGRGKTAAKEEKKPSQVGKLLGSYTTNNRITCTAAFVMIPRPEGAAESEDEIDEGEDEDENATSDEE